MSFKIKASHKFAGQSQVLEPVTEKVQPSSYLDYSLTTDSSTPTSSKIVLGTPKTTTDTNVLSGSGSGMAVRTSVTAMSDYY